MCANYVPVSQRSRLLTYFGVEHARDEPRHDVFPLGSAPFIRLDPEHKDTLVAGDGIFGLLPHFATELAYGRRTYNARSETVHKLASFKHAWAGSQRCVIPAEAIYEPNWESGRAVRWRISQPDDVPMGIAGIYRAWRAPDGRELFTFAMLTVNADEHPVMKRFHKPGDEKRMVIILKPEQYLPWLTCGIEAATSYFARYNGPLEASPFPLPSRAPRADGRVVRPPKPPDNDLFDTAG
ncbi:MAG TPA: SOS response-associated peptidase family protein [Methylibium sp.]|uniref:SOS response-associated peptidase n=1 Tax=Methylibium sp. TaxID=2067992 RepID=UPI002DB86093|nr:SOS response-associated peptidase family protein [Methylibium sp.]HEU4460864.1 SOS response-associated peptidase family protein [Methylibium sp.]